MLVQCTSNETIAYCFSLFLQHSGLYFDSSMGSEYIVYVSMWLAFPQHLLLLCVEYIFIYHILYDFFVCAMFYLMILSHCNIVIYGETNLMEC